MFKTKTIARMGIVAGLYSALSFLAFPIASGFIQIRLGEAMCVMPLFFPETAFSLFVGAIIVNLATGCALIDIFVGGAITLLAGIMTALIGKYIRGRWQKYIIGGLFPIGLNAVLLPLVWTLCYNFNIYGYGYYVLMLFVGEAISVYCLGMPVYLVSERIKQKEIK